MNAQSLNEKTLVDDGTSCTIIVVQSSSITTNFPFAGFQRVEYIESTGTQYFKVGSSFKTSYKIIIDFQMTLIGGDYLPIGMRNTGGYRYGIDVWNSKFTAITGGNDRTNMKAEDTNRHTITLDKSTATLDGTNYTIKYISYTFNDGVGVFYYNKIGDSIDSRTNSHNKLYKLEIYDENGGQLYDLYPVYRKSDSVIGMFNFINKTFYTNQGSGTFIKGPNI